jgi:hypothetical protein
LAKQPTSCKEKQDRETTSTPEAIAHELIIGSIYSPFSAKPLNRKTECTGATGNRAWGPREMVVTERLRAVRGKQLSCRRRM